MRALRRGAASPSCSICATALPCVRLPSSSLLIAAARVLSRSTRTASRHFFPGQGPWTSASACSCSRGGLLPPLSLQVQVLNPQTLGAAMSLARQLELQAQYTPPAKPATRGLLPAPPPRLALPAPPLANADKAVVVSDGRPQVKRLSMQEQEERRRLGLCFNCNEKYTRGHNRFCKRLFFLNGFDMASSADEAAKDPPDTEAPLFSLHAMAGVSVGSTIQLRVLLAAASFVALINTGSTHSFIGEAAARRTGLLIEPRPGLMATVANGERVSCPGVIRRAPIFLDGMEFCVNLFVMPLAGYDVVLGTNWMAALGPIVKNLQRFLSV